MRRALLDFKVKENLALTQGYVPTETSLQSPSESSSLFSKRKASARQVNQKPPLASLLRPTLGGFFIVLLLPTVCDKLYEWHQHSRQGVTAAEADVLPSPSLQEDKCSLSGNVRDCSCEYSQVDALNDEVVRPKLKELVTKGFFSYFKVDLHCKCPFWPEDGMCNLPACSVCECSDDQVSSIFFCLRCRRFLCSRRPASSSVAGAGLFAVG